MKAERLEKALGHRFRQRELLREALTHRSFGTPNNERLEFLGDGLLNCVVAAFLFERFPNHREGQLSRLRAHLVRQDALQAIAVRLDLGDQLFLGEGELKSGGATRPSILADALEALLGAIFLDAGFDAVQRVLHALYAPVLAELDPSAGRDAKTALQEILQGRKLPLPQYVLKSVSGEAHAQVFEVECQVPSLRLAAVGHGNSRRAAEQAAAGAVMERVR
ncbi:MAG TPA: ribonuclease III [Rhodocyclaceae bacterium]|nr:ribonuclease III [Rhodocyclaceae bacterium]